MADNSPNPSAPSSQAARHTILVVDDEPDVIRSVQDLLRLDYRILGTTKAAEAMTILEEEEVHVVMSDQRMPEMSGVELLHHVRGQYPEAIRLLFTGYADIHAVIEAINQGNIYRYITKPWDPDELQTIIREACERYDLLVQRKQLLVELSKKNFELELANAELKQGNELKKAFIQVASHELRTPLTILLGLSSLAVQTQKLPPPLDDWLPRIHKAAQRLQNLVDDIIQMLQNQQFGPMLQRQPMDLAALLNQAAEDVRPFVKLRRQNLAVEIAADIGAAQVDAFKIRDSLNHLLLNAIKFTPDEGRVTLRGKALADGQVEIQVADTGMGMDERCQARLFEPFFTGFDPAHHASGQFEFGRRGLGLGLSLVKEFVEMHGGTVRADCKQGKGSVFTITLPRQ